MANITPVESWSKKFPPLLAIKTLPYKTPRRDYLLKGQSLLSPFSPRSTLMQTPSTDL